MDREERERIVREAWHSWFREKYPEIVELTGPPPNAIEIGNRILDLAVPDGSVVVRKEGDAVVKAAVALADRLANEKWPKVTFSKLQPLFDAIHKYNRTALKGDS